MAIMIGIKPIIDGSGYHFDMKTIGELLFAGFTAYFGYVTKDYDVTGKP
jgi:hypothetical protein